MKKLLLTLGTVTSITAPIATTIACSTENEHFSGIATLEDTTLTIVGMEFTSIDDLTTETTADEYIGFLAGFAELLKDPAYRGVSTIATIDSIFNIPSYNGFDGPYAPDTLADITDYSWEAGTVGDGHIASADEIMAEFVFENLGSTAFVTNEDATEVTAALEALNVTSTFASDVQASGQATTAEEALTVVGLVADEFDKIIAALGTEWELERLDGDYTVGNTIWIDFHHVDEPDVIHYADIPVTWATS